MAEAIERFYPGALEDQYAEFAHHYARTDNARKAVRYVNVAGKQAMQRSAHADAITMLKRPPDPLGEFRGSTLSDARTSGDASPLVRADERFAVRPW